MTAWSRSGEDNDYLAPHIDLLLRSFAHWTGRPLLDSRHRTDAAHYLFHVMLSVRSLAAPRRWRETAR